MRDWCEAFADAVHFLGKREADRAAPRPLEERWEW